jgi:hypothetical protein
MADNSTALGKIASRRLRVRWFVCAAAIGPACRRVATFKTELVDGRRFPGYEHAEHEILHWIGSHNDERLHEELGDFAARRIRGVEYQDRQRAKPWLADKRASTNPGRFKRSNAGGVALSFSAWVMTMARMPVRVAGFNKLASVST